MTELPLLSIAIPSAKRPQALARLLRRLASEIATPEVDSSAVEVCVFNNGSHPESASAIAAAASAIPRFQTASSDRLLPVGDSFTNAINLATGTYVWVLGDDDLPLLGALAFILREAAEANRQSASMLQLQQHTCEEIDASVEQMEARCEPEVFSSATGLLNPHAFHWLGQMSSTILHRRFFADGSFFAGRRTDEIIPLLRAVVDALRSGSAICLKGRLFARTVDAGNWQGMMAFAHAIEFPRYWQFLKDAQPGLERPFQDGFLAGMVLRASILRDEAPSLYRSLQEVPSSGIRHSLARLFVRLIQPRGIRRLLVHRAVNRDPRRAASLERLREWDARV